MLGYFGVVVVANFINPVIMTKTNDTLSLVRDQQRDCYRDDQGRYYRIESDRVVQVDGIPPRSSWYNTQPGDRYSGK